MKNKIRICVLALFLIISQITTVKAETGEYKINVISDLNLNNVNIVNYGETQNELLSKAINNINSFNSDNNITKLKEAIKIAVDLHSNFSTEDMDRLIKEREGKEESDQFAYIFYKTTYIACNLDKVQKEELLMYICDEMYKSIAIRSKNELPNKVKEFLTDYLYTNFRLLVYNNDTLSYELTTKIAYTYYLCELTAEGKIIGEINPEYQPSKEEVPAAPNYDEMPKQTLDGVELIKDVSTNIDNDITQENLFNQLYNTSAIKNIMYKSDLGKCKKIIESYNIFGNLLTKEEVETGEEELAYCGIFENVDFGNGITSGKEQITNITIATILDGGVYNTESNLSDYSLQFTLEKKNKNAYFYDTGMRLTSDMEADKSQLRDLNLILASKTKGFHLEDGNRSLSIIEGKPYLIDDKKEKYSKDEIEKLYSNFINLSVKIDKIKMGLTNTIEKNE